MKIENAEYRGDIVDDRDGFYYVSVVDAGRLGLLAGPFTRHADALAIKDRASRVAEKVDWRAAFYAFGTVNMNRDAGPGVLNKELGLECPTIGTERNQQ